MNQKTNTFNIKAKTFVKSLFVLGLTALSVTAFATWQAPTLPPNGGNIEPPINTSTANQYKTGGLVVGGFRSIGSAGIGIFDNDVSVGGTLSGQNPNAVLTTTKLKVTNGAAANKVLTSDAAGNATWQDAPGGGGGGGATWGSITGTLASQTDLNTALNGKQALLVNSAGLAGALTDETGTGFAVFSNSPTFTGTPSLPSGTTGVTQALGDNSTKLATTAFVIANASGGGGTVGGSGTTNYLPRWSSSSALTDSNIIQETGTNDIGVSTATPGSKLSVYGNSAIGTAYSQLGGPSNGLIVEGFMGVGNSTPAALFSVGGGSSADPFQIDTFGNITRVNNVATSFPSVQGAANTFLQNNGSGVLSWVTSPGGMTDPMTTAGDLIIRNVSNVTTRLGTGGSGNQGQILTILGNGIPAWVPDLSLKNSDSNPFNSVRYIPFFSGSNSIGSSVMYQEAGTNEIGIATVTPGAQLDVAGTGIKTTAFQMPTGAVNNYVLTSNATGVASWQAVAPNGANTTLSNLVSPTAVNQSLIPGTINLNLGSPSTGWGNLYMSGASSSPAINKFLVTGIATAPRTISFPDATDTLVGKATTDNLSNKSLQVSSDVIGGVTMTLGSDAGYDMYYRNSSGILSRIPNGTTGQVLTATSSNAPSWGTTISLPTATLNGTTLRYNGSAWVIDTNLFNLGAGGNVGIGTTSPAKKLDVSGDALLNGLTAGRGGGNISSNTAFGSTALNAVNTGGNNTGIGYQALNSNTSGYSNTAIGSGAMNTNSSGFSNVALGLNALYGSGTNGNTGNANVAIGNIAMNNNSSGTANTAVGYSALSVNTIGINNTAVGYQALNSSNGASGQSDKNTAVGYQAMFSNTTGTSNTALGNGALASNTTGTNNLALGDSANVVGTGLTYATAIGSGATVNSSSSMMFGGSNVKKWGFGVASAGSNAILVGNDSSNGNGAYLDVAGVWHTPSDRTKKHDILDIKYGLADVMKLRPVTFAWNGTNQKDVGFIAQEVKQIIPESVSGEDGHMGISYSQLTAVLAKAIQEQQKEIEDLKAEVELLKNKKSQ